MKSVVYQNIILSAENSSDGLMNNSNKKKIMTNLNLSMIKVKIAKQEYNKSIVFKYFSYSCVLRTFFILFIAVSFPK